jgi:hypothetical protein
MIHGFYIGDKTNATNRVTKNHQLRYKPFKKLLGDIGNLSYVLAET